MRPACPRPTTASPPRASHCRQTCRPIPAASTPSGSRPSIRICRSCSCSCSRSCRSGAFAALWLLDCSAQRTRLGLSALASLGLAGSASARPPCTWAVPCHAWRALRDLGHSWLSREVLSLSAVCGCGFGIRRASVVRSPGRSSAGFATSLLGIAGVTCSARIYRCPRAPRLEQRLHASPNSLPPRFCSDRCSSRASASRTNRGLLAAAAGGAAQLLTQALKFLWLSRLGHFRTARFFTAAVGTLRQAVPASGWRAGGRRDRAPLVVLSVPLPWPSLPSRSRASGWAASCSSSAWSRRTWRLPFTARKEAA